MDRFVVFIGDGQRPSASGQIEAWTRYLTGTSASWTEVRLSDTFRAFIRGSPRCFSGEDGSGHGLVIGTLFARGQGRKGAITTLTPRDIGHLARDDHDALSGAHWGDFSAIWRSAENGSVGVYRDPTGATPCFRTHVRGVDILFSHAGDVAGLPGIDLTIDWTALRAFLVNNYFITRHTGFHEIQEILPGEQVLYRGAEAPRSRWPFHPADVASRPHRLSVAKTAEMLRAAAEDCFEAWGAGRGDIAIRLSGGVDSTIVTGLARKHASGKVTALHMRGKGYEARELEYARLGARHAGVELVELEPPQKLFGPSTFVTPPLLARPDSQLLGGPLDAILAQACASLNVQSVMTGHGGDSVFLQHGMAEAALVDFVRLNGFGKHFARTVYETATLQQISVWSVLNHLRKRLLKTKTWAPYSDLTMPAAAEERPGSPVRRERIPDQYVFHPCLSNAHKLPPCKAQQVTSLLALRNYHSRLAVGDRFNALEPLTSQPIVELSLQTPAHLFNAGGLDRGLERSAFADLLPDRISNRFQKGFVNHQMLQDMQSNIEVLREYLVDSRLVSHGVIARNEVLALLTEDEMTRGRNLSRLLSVLTAELWLQSCASHSSISARHAHA